MKHLVHGPRVCHVLPLLSTCKRAQNHHKRGSGFLQPWFPSEGFFGFVEGYSWIKEIDDEVNSWLTKWNELLYIHWFWDTCMRNKLEVPFEFHLGEEWILFSVSKEMISFNYLWVYVCLYFSFPFLNICFDSPCANFWGLSKTNLEGLLKNRLNPII